MTHISFTFIHTVLFYSLLQSHLFVVYYRFREICYVNSFFFISFALFIFFLVILLFIIRMLLKLPFFTILIAVFFFIIIELQ